MHNCEQNQQFQPANIIREAYNFCKCLFYQISTSHDL